MSKERHPVTVVTAYYPIQSKHRVSEYCAWIREFWPRLPKCALVFYTDPSTLTQIQGLFPPEAAGRVEFRVASFQELRAFQGARRLLWLAAHARDPEAKIHTPELYGLWYEKKEFVARAIQENPFGSEFFVWADAGIGRTPAWIPMLQGFPAAETIPRGTMLALQIEPFQAADWERGADGLRGAGFGSRATVGGGVLASDASGWERWSGAYDAMLQRMCEAGRFIGKDQTVMATMILEDPSLAVLLPAPVVLGPIQKWFALLFWLAGLWFGGGASKPAFAVPPQPPALPPPVAHS